MSVFIDTCNDREACRLLIEQAENLNIKYMSTLLSGLAFKLHLSKQDDFRPVPSFTPYTLPTTKSQIMQSVDAFLDFVANHEVLEYHEKCGWLHRAYLVVSHCCSGVAIDPESCQHSGMPFGEAHAYAMQGRFIARSGWNGRGIYVGFHKPKLGDAMTAPYMFIDSTGLQTDNPDAPRVRCPWAPSQTDMSATDWRVVNNQ